MLLFFVVAVVVDGAVAACRCCRCRCRCYGCGCCCCGWCCGGGGDLVLVVVVVVNGAVVVVALPCHFLRFSEDKHTLPVTLVATRENPSFLTFSRFGRISCCCF